MAREERQSAHDSWKASQPAFDDEPTEVRRRLQEMWGPFSEACEPLVRKTVKEEERKLKWWQTAGISLLVAIVATAISAFVAMVIASSQADGVQDGKIEVNQEDITELRKGSDSLGGDVQRLDREVGELGTKVEGLKTSVDSLAKEIREDRAHRQVQNPYAYPGPQSGP